MRKVMIVLIAGTALAVWSIAQLPEKFLKDFPYAEIRMKVVDEEDKAVAEAEVKLSGGSELRDLIEDDERKSEGKTDKQGRFKARVRTFGFPALLVRKEGYYETWYQRYKIQAEDRNVPDQADILLTLKKIRNPIGMYARRVNLGIPEYSKPIGFDAQVVDWVSPYGQGKQTDFILTAEVDKKSEREYKYKLVVGFPNPKDGIMEFKKDQWSAFNSPYKAPESGYKQEWIQRRERTPDAFGISNYAPETRAFIFRVRTELDEQGNIRRAHYGKIYGDFMKFTLYLNPTPNDRNLEFDPEKNLFGELPIRERVKNP